MSPAAASSSSCASLRERPGGGELVADLRHVPVPGAQPGRPGRPTARSWPPCAARPARASRRRARRSGSRPTRCGWPSGAVLLFMGSTSPWGIECGRRTARGPSPADQPRTAADRAEGHARPPGSSTTVRGEPRRSARPSREAAARSSTTSVNRPDSADAQPGASLSPRLTRTSSSGKAVRATVRARARRPPMQLPATGCGSANIPGRAARPGRSPPSRRRARCAPGVGRHHDHDHPSRLRAVVAGPPTTRGRRSGVGCVRGPRRKRSCAFMSAPPS